jgi:cell division protein FtsB
MKKTIEVFKRKYILLAGLLLVAVVTVFGDKGIYELYKVRQERDGILAYNHALESENRELERHIRLLETDKKYIGQIARKELGKLGRNELVYKIEPPAKDKAGEPARK